MATQLAPMDAMRSTLTKMSPEFQAALPPQINVEKFIRTTLTAVQMQPLQRSFSMRPRSA